MANVVPERIPPHAEIDQRYIAARKRGEIDNPRENVLFFWTVNPGEVHFNTTRVVGLSALDAYDLTRAEVLARQQVQQMVTFLKHEISGFEQAYLAKMAPQIGIRESRRLSGSYQLTSADVLQARKFEDGIACSCYDIDIHNPTGSGTVIKRLPPGEWYQIPYRTLIPLEIKNCLIGCRCISATHAAHSSLRIMPVVAAIGQAAGTAAALACKMNVMPADVPVDILQTELRKNGAFIDSHEKKTK